MLAGSYPSPGYNVLSLIFVGKNKILPAHRIEFHIK